MVKEVLDQKELIRYNRQLRIPEFGEAGQKRLKRSHVLIAGIGGLGHATITRFLKSSKQALSSKGRK